MNIAFLSTFYPFRGGIAQFNARLYSELNKEHNVSAFNFTTQYPSFLFPGKTQFVDAQDSAMKISSERVLSSINLLTFGTTSKKILLTKPDFLLTSYWMPFTGFSLGKVSGQVRKSSAKTIALLHNAMPHEQNFLDKTLTKYFLNRNDKFVVLSESVKSDLLSLRPDASVLKLFHPLYDHFGEKLPKADAMKQLNLDPYKKTLLFFGLIREYKGLDVLLQAFSKLDDSYQLVIAGEVYGSFDSYQKIIDTSSNKDRIHLFTHYIEDSKVPAFFSAADVLVLPYRSGTQSGVTAIAYHFDLPVIATDVGGLKEIIRDGETGIIVPACEPDLIANAIRKFFEKNSSGKFQPHISAMKEELSWKKFSDQLIAFAQED